MSSTSTASSTRGSYKPNTTTSAPSTTKSSSATTSTKPNSRTTTSTTTRSSAKATANTAKKPSSSSSSSYSSSRIVHSTSPGMRSAASAAAEIARVRLIVSGKVQGVFFRKYTNEQAKAYKLKGWVRNNPDGNVEILAEGPKDRCQNIIDWCRTKGSPKSKVENVEVHWETPNQNEFKDFTILR